MIPYRTKRQKNGTISIRIKCPVCRKWGRLLADGTQFSGRAFKVRHDDGWCHIAAGSDLRPVVEEVYLYVRRGVRG